MMTTMTTTTMKMMMTIPNDDDEDEVGDNDDDENDDEDYDDEDVVEDGNKDDDDNDDEDEDNDKDEHEDDEEEASSETQGQLVGTTGFSWAKVYNKSGRAPGHLLLPNEFQKRLKSRLLIGQKKFFLANQRRGTAGRLSCLLTRRCFPHQSL